MTSGGGQQSPSRPVLRPRPGPVDSVKKAAYRCSLIQLDSSQPDEELDAILGELTVLESQFEQELGGAEGGAKAGVALSPASVDSDRSRSSSNITDLSKDSGTNTDQGIHSASHSRSSSGSDDIKQAAVEVCEVSICVFNLYQCK